MIKRVAIFILLLCFAFSGCAHPANVQTISDEQAIGNTMFKIIETLNTTGMRDAFQYCTSSFSVFSFEETELNALADLPPANGIPQKALHPKKLAMPIYKLHLDSYNARVYQNTAILTGTVSGSYISSGGEELTGPWGLSAFWVKENGVWLLEHYHSSKIKVHTLSYLVQLPNGYEQTSTKKWPMILFLHGLDGMGDNLDYVKEYNLPKRAESGKNFPFVLISPQCPGNAWDAELIALSNLLDEVISKYNIDTDRIYLTGQSMGGHGTWILAETYPDRFAAIAPVCGWGDPSRADSLVNTPVWAFHGDQDTAAPIDNEQKIVDALKDAGGDVTFTVYKGADHNVWDLTYGNEDLYAWFLRHAKSSHKTNVTQ